MIDPGSLLGQVIQAMADAWATVMPIGLAVGASVVALHAGWRLMRGFIRG